MQRPCPDLWFKTTTYIPSCFALYGVRAKHSGTKFMLFTKKYLPECFAPTIFSSAIKGFGRSIPVLNLCFSPKNTCRNASPLQLLVVCPMENFCKLVLFINIFANVLAHSWHI
jgi:hypothetical protein